MAPPRIPVKDRLLANYRLSEQGCWEWQRSCTRDGYGVLGIGRNNQWRAHRAAYEEFVGPIPDGMLVCHHCDNPRCINPAHLFLGTAKDNMQDKSAKGRNPKEMVKKQKIPHAEYDKIREIRMGGSSLKELAAIYGVSFGTISAICLGRRSYGRGN